MRSRLRAREASPARFARVGWLRVVSALPLSFPPAPDTRRVAILCLVLAPDQGRESGWRRRVARSLRSLARYGQGLPPSSRGVVVDALPMVARLPPQSASFRSPPPSACNRLSPAIRPAPIVVPCALASLACLLRAGSISLPLFRPRARSTPLASVPRATQGRYFSPPLRL